MTKTMKITGKRMQRLLEKARRKLMTPFGLFFIWSKAKGQGTAHLTATKDMHDKVTVVAFCGRTISPMDSSCVIQREAHICKTCRRVSRAKFSKFKVGTSRA